MPTNDVFELAKPFAWMALTAFLVGFVSYFLFNGTPPTFAQPEPAPAAAVSGPASDDWNVVKHI